MNNNLKTEVEKRLYLILSYDKKTLGMYTDELKTLTILYKELNKTNYKNITLTDLIPSIFFICITSILITALIILL